MLILFPNQLFPIRYLPKTDLIILIEHPLFFGYRSKKIKFSKTKILYNFVTIREYRDYLLKNKRDVKLVSLENLMGCEEEFVEESFLMLKTY